MRDCTGCGNCCENWGADGLSATADEIAWWEDYRPDIAAYVSDDGEIWVEPVTGRKVMRCPWLTPSPDGRRKLCAIYPFRPGDCRLYPSNLVEMQRDRCEMLEARDLDNPARAQQQLDAMKR